MKLSKCANASFSGPSCDPKVVVPTFPGISTAAVGLRTPRVRLYVGRHHKQDADDATCSYTSNTQTGQQDVRQQYANAADVTFTGSPHQQQTLARHLQHHSPQRSLNKLHQLLCNPKLGGALLTAALVALAMPGRRSTAVAGTLPPPWQITDQYDQNHSTSGSSSTYGGPARRSADAAGGCGRGSSDLASVQSSQFTAVAALAEVAALGQPYNSSSSPHCSSQADLAYSSSSTSSSSYPGSSILNADTSTGGAATAAPNSSMGGTPSSSTGSTAGPSGHGNSSSTAAGLEDLLAYERATVNLFAAARPSVVNITHLRAMQNFYTLDVHRMAVGQGSGFIWDRNGHVITNYHVIKGAAEVKVTLHDHSSCTARVVGYDPSKDIAVLKLALPRGRLEALRPVQLGSSSALRVGQAVFAIGNPFGLDHTLTKGIVSGLGREASAGLTAIKGVIQTDAAINPGNSGGVLLNSQGAVIGVNFGILDPSGKGSFSGVGFAIPIDTVKGLVEQILQHGRVRRPSLGISIAPEQVLDQLGADGVLVLEVPAGTPAAAAGLRPTYRDVFGDIVLGDIIVGMDTRPIRSTADLVVALDERRPGDKVRCDVLRDGKRLSMTVTLGERGAYCE